MLKIFIVTLTSPLLLRKNNLHLRPNGYPRMMIYPFLVLPTKLGTAI
jgi:hypothetical protein